MSRTLVCVHCGSSVALESAAETDGTRPLAHLLGLHGELLLAFDELPRMAELLEHFRAV